MKTESLLKEFCKKHLNERFIGKVEEIKSQRVYVSFNGFVGLLSAKDISWGYIKDIRKYFSIGEEIEIIVLGYDENKKKIVVGRKQLLDDPLFQIADSMFVGKEIKGVLKFISKKRRAYIEIDGGAIVEATIPSGFTYPLEKSIVGTILNIDINLHLIEIKITSKLIEKNDNVIVTYNEKINLKKNIAVVQFYDAIVNDFGRVLTNSLGIGRNDSANKLHSIYLSKDNWNADGFPEDGEWIVINTLNNTRGLVAINGERLSYDKEGLKLALPYRGKYARITGRDIKGNQHDYNVICHVVGEILKRVDGENIVIASLIEYLASFDTNEIDGIIKEFLLDYEFTKYLIILLPKIKVFNRYSEVDAIIINTLVSNIESDIISKNNLSVFNDLPIDFDYIPYLYLISKLLDDSIKSKNRDVLVWLKNHTYILKVLTSNTASLSLDLLYVISQLTQCLAVFVGINKPWNEIYNWLKLKTITGALSFLVLYFTDKDSLDVEKSDIKNVLGYEEKKELVKQLLVNPSHHLKLLELLAGDFVNDDFDLICDYINKNIDISHIYNKISLYLDFIVRNNETEVCAFFDLCLAHAIMPKSIMDSIESMSDEMALEMFAQTADLEYLNAVNDFEAVPQWLNVQSELFVCKFLQSCRKSIIEEADKEAIADTIDGINEEKFRAAIILLTEDEQYKILQLCPDDYAKEVVSKYFVDTKLFDLYIEEQWKKMKSQIPYVSFDIESNGESIKEFAFRTDENTKAYQGEEQLGSLLRVLRRSEIIVGHRIKEWDIEKVLKKKGFQSNAFIWDTLEIEILLNPCRYSYALKTSHSAKEDTEMVDRLFWNQLYRLSQNEDLCLELIDMLPKRISEILISLRQPIFSSFFSKESDNDGFYQVLVDVDKDVASRLEGIDGSNEKSLVIAPKRLWSRISEHASLRFVQEQEDIDYLNISKKLLLAKPLDDKFLNAVLLRFVHFAKTPVVANLSQYLRINYLTDDILTAYVAESEGNVDCADLSFITKETDMSYYDHIFFVGCEIENRLNQYSLPNLYTISDFWVDNSSIPMRLGASSYLAISQEDRNLNVFKDIPADAANVWIERTVHGKYIISYNYDYYSIIRLWAEKSSKEQIIDKIPWTSRKEDSCKISLIHSAKRKGQEFDYVSKRVSATSRYKSMYWTYQFALLNHLQANVNTFPIIFVLDDALEIEKVETYARYLGYYVPKEGTLMRKLELIEHYNKGMIVVCKDSFFDIIDWRKDTPYCYVWDHLALEKHMMMWRGFTDDIAEKQSGGKLGSIKDTYQSALLSIWPVYEYYYDFIRANSEQSTMYVLDSFLEEYHYLSSVIGTSSYSATDLWQKEEDFNEALNIAGRFFNEEKQADINEADVDNAMKVILMTLIKTDKKPNPEWSPIQKEILPQILSRCENYLVSLPTGGGKSVLFQGPALYNSAYTNKLTIVVTPLKALMQDQVKELSDKGFVSNIDYLNGDRSYQEVKSIYRKVTGGEIAILYVTPERFRSKAFLNAITTRMSNDNGLEYMVFDEAHCISQWGMEFRPEYLNVIKKCKELKDSYGNNMCVAMFSATVTDMIFGQINDVIPVKRLGQDNDRKLYNPIRSHIGMEFMSVAHDISYRINVIVEYIKKYSIDPTKSRMLVFCKTRNQCEEIALMLANELQKLGLVNKTISNQSVGYFHAGMSGEDREEIYTRFKDDDDPLYILCATKAFGMGMDIPNIHYIVHLMPPSVLEDYLQEVGRAGRNEEMYRRVGFSVDNPIPALCLFSKDDIKKSKEQLLQSMLSWKNLEEIRDAIETYISNIQTLERTKLYPVVVPNTLWANGKFDYEFTDFRIGLYWLERLNRIKMGYLSSAYINVTLLDNEGKLNGLSSFNNGKFSIDVLSELRKIQNDQNRTTIQVPLQTIASNLSMATVKLLDCLIWCENHKLIKIEQKTRCHISFTRLSEVDYMLHNNVHDVAFYVILNATRALLGNNRLGVECNYSLADIKRFIKESDNLEAITKQVNTINEDKQESIEKYMIWYDENDKQKNNGLSIAKSYHNDLYKKRYRQVISLLEMIPDVKVKSYLDIKKKSVLQSVIVETNSWKTFLEDFEKDCCELLSYVHNMKEQDLYWSKAMSELKLLDKGFVYFNNLLQYLNGMAYLSTDALLPSGIEIYTTDSSKNLICENITEGSSDAKVKSEFDEAINIRNLRLYIMDVLTTKIHNKQKLQELISSYFLLKSSDEFISLLGKYYEENDSIWEPIRATAIKNAEEQLKNNPEQWLIYQENSNTNINVEAGPGSGKTHVLTLKCAKLIFHQHVNPKSILVLAYNRAVVVELKNRLSKLFASLGLSSSASHLHIYTFHGLAKRICGDASLKDYEMKEWEEILLNTIIHKPNEVRAVMPDLQYVFIDEFQDITQIRLDAMFELRKIYNPLIFFTIGDKDQSIYGFEKKESMNPNYYYEQLYNILQPKKMTMTINYRSYPKILEYASAYLPPDSHIPIPCESNRINEPNTNYALVFNNNERVWENDFANFIRRLQNLNVSDVAVFFRTNNEVYRGYSLIKSLNLQGIRIRVQGASVGELFRIREIYSVLRFLEENRHRRIEIENYKSERELKEKIADWIKKCPNWDSFYMDFAFVLILDYLDFAASDEETHTYGDMADAIRETLKEDNAQIYKLYENDRFASRRILEGEHMNVVLTTMHKVKGLEFDAVIITPSVASLPFNPLEGVKVSLPLSSSDIESIEEEQRLLYVAYTRAKKFLFVYKGDRELAIERKHRFVSLEDNWGIRERQVGLENYNIGYNAGYNYRNHRYIAYNVRKNDPVSVKRYVGTRKSDGKTFVAFNIMHNGNVVGQLSDSSSIARKMKTDDISILGGFFVSDVFYWSYEDSLAAEKRKEDKTSSQGVRYKNSRSSVANYVNKWSDEAKKQGYIFVVDIAGYGK